MSGTIVNSGTIALKAGENLRLALVFTNSDGTIPDLTTATMSVTFRDALGALIATAPITPGASPGTWGVNVADTSGWPTGRLVADLLVTGGSPPATALSQTFQCFVNPPVSAT